MDIKEIMETIPHRPPFLLLDKVLEVDPGKRVIAIKNVTMNEYFFPGHFPVGPGLVGEPVMPGVLIVEALAQAGAVALLTLEEFRGKIPFFGAIDNCKFRAKVVPGDVLLLDVEFIKLKKQAGIGKGIAMVSGKKVAEAQLTFMIG